MDENAQADPNLAIQTGDTSAQQIISSTPVEAASGSATDLVATFGIEKLSTSASEDVIMKTLDEIKKENDMVRTRLDKQDEMFKA
ncbi:unnamed protein product [Vicia faba]|uniref:Uncharacterized protein n=1 Tax=Vicia faba TaxID=3906 RepID=A0AAV0YVF6_VICFA|nr:unnamed protein product [Vicia faba]